MSNLLVGYYYKTSNGKIAKVNWLSTAKDEIQFGGVIYEGEINAVWNSLGQHEDSEYNLVETERIEND